MVSSDGETMARTREAVAELQAAVIAVASDVVARIDERCPYRAREDRCTFALGCRNQRPELALGERVVRCAGDQQLWRSDG